MNIPLLGCNNHRLTIATEAYLRENVEDVMEQIATLMSKLSTNNLSGFN